MNNELVEAIRCCITKDCVNCPYAIKGCERAMLQDTLNVLRPHILTLDEVKSSVGTIVWLERPWVSRSVTEFALIESELEDGRVQFWYVGGEKCLLKQSDYNKTWRCWNIKPSDEEVKWNE